ncbi:DUF456 domain-containing protein [Chitinibacter sp. S2-10]|uniref:DUF456 domain-containing protein n=1 Tax=Chitinibacter sp. S2-10 TaxID=3373597 RepID=UPI0039777F24
MDIIWWIISICLILAGIAGIVLPILPATALVFAGMLLIAWQQNFQTVSIYTMIVLGVLALLAGALDYIAGALGAKMVGASRAAIWGATLGAILGVFAGPVGLIFGPLLGAVAGEFYATRNHWQSGKVGIASWLGLILGMIAKVGIIFMMLGIFWLAYLI